MKTSLVAFGFLILSSGCAVTRDGAEAAPPAAAVQGSNDVQGAPIYSGTGPTIGVGVGSSGRSGAGIGFGIGF